MNGLLWIVWRDKLNAGTIGMFLATRLEWKIGVHLMTLREDHLIWYLRKYPKVEAWSRVTF